MKKDKNATTRQWEIYKQDFPEKELATVLNYLRTGRRDPAEVCDYISALHSAANGYRPSGVNYPLVPYSYLLAEEFLQNLIVFARLRHSGAIMSIIKLAESAIDSLDDLSKFEPDCEQELRDEARKLVRFPLMISPHPHLQKRELEKLSKYEVGKSNDFNLEKDPHAKRHWDPETLQNKFIIKFAKQVERLQRNPDPTKDTEYRDDPLSWKAKALKLPPMDEESISEWHEVFAAKIRHETNHHPELDPLLSTLGGESEGLEQARAKINWELKRSFYRAFGFQTPGKRDK